MSNKIPEKCKSICDTWYPIRSIMKCVYNNYELKHLDGKCVNRLDNKWEQCYKYVNDISNIKLKINNAGQTNEGTNCSRVL